jgi:hypothetical protein
MSRRGARSRGKVRCLADGVRDLAGTVWRVV